jgi:uncharacterized protein DUF4232
MKPLLYLSVLALVSGGNYSRSLAAQATPNASLAILERHVENGHIVLTVRNTGKRTITAWGATGFATFDGGGRQVVGVVSDGYETGFRSYPSGQVVVLTPGATVTTQIGTKLRDTTVTDIAVAPSLVVFDDGTAIGDEPNIDLVFAGRRREREAWRLIESIVTRQLATQVEALTTVGLIEGELDALANDEVRSTGAYSNFRRNLSLGVEGASAGRLDLGKRLRQMQQDATLHRAAADRNYQRR